MSVLSNQLVNTINANVSDVVTRATDQAKNAAELGRDDFLKLLVAQLTYQDPLNPMDDKDFTAQLAQFSSLDQLIKISDGVDQMNIGAAQQNLLNAASFIGKEIRAAGYSLTKKDGAVENTIYVYMADNIAGGAVNIYNSIGELVYSEKLGAMSADQVFEYAWNGRNYSGDSMPDGVYYVSISAEDANGSPVLLGTEISGVVAGVQLVNGVQYFRLADGRNVRLDDVIEVVDRKTSAADAGDTAGGAGDGAGDGTP